MAAANLADVQSVANLIAPIPNNQPLKEALQAGFAGSVDIYDAHTGTARYLRADGKLVVCFILAGVTQQEALAVREALAKVAVNELGYKRFEAAVRSIIQSQISRVN